MYPGAEVVYSKLPRHYFRHASNFEDTPMAAPSSRENIKKELGLFDVFTLATGATISFGFFLLPGVAAVMGGSILPVAYLVAALVLLPGLLAKIELATAMPRSGGVYFFLDRSMGPLWGTMTGFGTWISLILKTAFALIGGGAYLGIFFPGLPLGPVAGGLAIVFGVLNLFGAQKTGQAQGLLVIGLLLLVAWFSGLGAFNMDMGYLTELFTTDPDSLIATSGFVIVSYMGLTKVAGVAGEVKNPERNLPLGMLLAFGVTILVYVVGSVVMLGVVGPENLAANGGDLTPAATAAAELVGRPGAIVMAVAALLGIFSVANAGILSASRYPMAMAKDRILPERLAKVNDKTGTPVASVVLTVAAVLLFVLVFNPMKIAKLASAFQILMFAMSTIAVIVMREARLDSYDPSFRSPLYPWLQIAGIVAGLWLIFQMGWLAIGFTVGLLWFGALWYRHYASDRVARSGAIFNLFERLGRSSNSGLDRELREILKEKGLRQEDPFDEIIARSHVLDVSGASSFEDVVDQAASWLAHRLPITAHAITRKFLEGTRVGGTPVTRGVALPHLSLDGLNQPEMVIARIRDGMRVLGPDLETDPEEESTLVTALFFLISPKDNPGQHLRILAQIARRVDNDSFLDDWKSAEGEQGIKEVLLADEHFIYITLGENVPARELVGKSLKEVHLPAGNLIPVIKRGDQNIIPRGDTVLEDGDRLTVIGEPDFLTGMKRTYCG